MGKTSALLRAMRQVASRGGRAFAADLSTASSMADMANRLLESAHRALGRRWQDVAGDIARRVGVTVTMSPDHASGMMLPSIAIDGRNTDPAEQSQTFVRVLDAIEAMAADRETTVGIVLDEFQEISTLGGEQAEWQLRGAIQHHRHASYVLAGSGMHLIRRMVEPSRALYGLLDVLYFGPMDQDHLATWIDARMTAAGVRARGVGERAISIAGPRTRDIVQLALVCFDRTVTSRRAAPADVDAAFAEVVQRTDDMARAIWHTLTPHQQNVLRAVAVSGTGVMSRPTVQRFALRSTASISKALGTLVQRGVLTREPGADYEFDSPFFRGWVVSRTLPDAGIKLPVTYLPAETARALPHDRAGRPARAAR
jgi:hypothetical protein